MLPQTSELPARTIDGFDGHFVLRGPGAYLFTLEDTIQVDTLCSASGVTLTISGAMLTPDLQIRPFAQSLTPNSNRTIATARFNPGAGWLQHVRLVASSGTPLLGQCFAWVRIARGLTAAALAHGTIASGYVTASTDLYFPGTNTINPLDSPGALRAVVGTTPAAGAELLETVPTGARWQVRELQTQLNTSAGVANRVVEIVIDDGANIVFRHSLSNNIAAGANAKVTWYPGYGNGYGDFAGNFKAPMPPDLWLAPGHRVRTITANLQVGDQYIAPAYSVREWLEGN